MAVLALGLLTAGVLGYRSEQQRQIATRQAARAEAARRQEWLAEQAAPAQ